MDQPPTVLFDSYEQDFLHIIGGVRQKLEGDARNSVGEQRKAALRKVEIELDEADDIVSQLETEIQGIPKSIQGVYTTRLKQARSDLNKYKKLSKDLHSQAARSDLLGAYSPGRGSGRGTPSSDDPYGERSDRERLLTGTEILGDGSRRLQESTSLALQTEAHGAEILTTLRGQREQIENSRDMLDTADRHIDRASGTMTKMIRQMYKQRVILGGIAAFFVILIITILYFKLVRR
ncbi:vesicle transport v-snare protein vti1 [Coprinellus micaceus]|uniref:Vesicle transport v-snare protein vti1 n=1 Tax=Coprinellus micaceus TaxID=71717 RepID=A0A4Y7SC88_COPMI|nr:vesicle transport v-snare protein vti1 [Coprinellus micaceus]